LKNENEILQALIQGDENAFRLLYELYSSRVYNTALSYTKIPEDAEEITQDVFVKIHKNASKFQKKSSLSTWIYRITVNTSINFVNRKNRFKIFKSQSSTSTPIEFNHPGVLLENKEGAALLFKVIEGLPTNQKTAFILSFIEDLPRQEVAQIMNTSLKSVESLLQRAKKNMRIELEKNHPKRRKNKK